MPIKFNFCPHCNKKISFKIEMDDINPSHYPAPVYIHHKDESCNKISTFYMDSRFQVSYKELEKKKSITGREIKTIKTIQ